MFFETTFTITLYQHTMNRSYLKLSLIPSALCMVGGATTALVSAAIANIDTVPLKVSELTEAQKRNWWHADRVAHTIPGMGVEKAYGEMIKNQKGKTVVVTVLDT